MMGEKHYSYKYRNNKEIRTHNTTMLRKFRAEHADEVVNVPLSKIIMLEAIHVRTAASPLPEYPW